LRFRLIPRDDTFYPMFDSAAENIADCAREMRTLLHDLPNAAQHQETVKSCERRGDEITAQILRKLASSFVTPFDREDIHALTEELDDVVDDIEAACALIVLHRVEEPLPEMDELVDILVKAAETNIELIAKLSTLRGLEPQLDAIDKYESAADKVYQRAIATLFSGEYDAFDVLKLKDVVEAIEGSVNSIENVGDIVESIVLKHA